MRAGDGDLEMAGHQPGQHLPPAQHREALSPGRGQLGVILLHRGGVDHDVGVSQVLGGMALVKQDSQGLQARGAGIGRQIGAAHPMPLAHQQFGQAAHADAADADEVVGFYCLAPYNIKLKFF